MIPMTLETAAAASGGTCEARHQRIVALRVCTDSRGARPGDLFVAIRGERFDGHEYLDAALERGAVGCMVDRRWASDASSRSRATVPAVVVNDTVAGLGRLAGYYRRRLMNRATAVVAVTGTNGKTTTKALIDHVLAGSLKGRAALKSFNNAIGVPLTLLAVEPDDRYVVLEMGTNHPGELAALAAVARADVAVITSVGEAHLEGLGDIDGVAAEKVSLLRFLGPDGLAVVNIDRPEIRPQLNGAVRAALITVGHNPAADVRVEDLASDLACTRFTLEGRLRAELPLPGAHHATNAAAAYVVARRFGVGSEEVLERFATFPGVEGRGRVLELCGIRVVDDSYNANPASMTAAVEALALAGGRRIFVMGDMRELGGASVAWHRRIIAEVFAAGVELLITVGPDGQQALAEMAAGPGPSPPGTSTVVIACDDAAAASGVLATRLLPGDTAWIKGSRALGLERIVADLQARFRRPSAVA